MHRGPTKATNACRHFTAELLDETAGRRAGRGVGRPSIAEALPPAVPMAPLLLKAANLSSQPTTSLQPALPTPRALHFFYSSSPSKMGSPKLSLNHALNCAGAQGCCGEGLGSTDWHRSMICSVSPPCANRNHQSFWLRHGDQGGIHARDGAALEGCNL